MRCVCYVYLLRVVTVILLTFTHALVAFDFTFGYAPRPFAFCLRVTFDFAFAVAHTHWLPHLWILRSRVTVTVTLYGYVTRTPHSLRLFSWLHVCLPLFTHYSWIPGYWLPRPTDCGFLRLWLRTSYAFTYRGLVARILRVTGLALLRGLRLPRFTFGLRLRVTTGSRSHYARSLVWLLRLPVVTPGLPRTFTVDFTLVGYVCTFCLPRV